MKCFCNHNYILSSIVPKKEAVLLKCTKCGDVKIVDKTGEHKNRVVLWRDIEYLSSERWEKISKVFEPGGQDIQYKEKRLENMKFCFGDIVIVEGGMIGVVVKSWCRSSLGNEPSHDVYVRMYNGIKNYPESKMQRYMVRHKYLSEEEKEYQKNAVEGL